jgi:glycosyltransferase involved in cell wall biosynthesis
MKPRISILTPIYNGAQFLSECVEHVSSHKIPDLEHIIIDGASTDGTPVLLEKLSQKHPHLRFISEKDHGQSDALNKGIKLARSGVIGILNADDFYEPGAISAGLDYLEGHHRVDFVAGDCIIWKKDQDQYINRPRDLRLESLVLGWDFAEYPCNPSAYFYRKSVHEAAGLYDVEDHYTMDFSFILACAASVRMAYVPKTWGNFRLSPGTKTFEDIAKGPGRLRAIREHWKGKMTRAQHLRSSLIYHRRRMGKTLPGQVKK